MRKQTIRNIAIIAHVDHGKTTLVDGLLKQSGAFRENQIVEDRIMDSLDLEKERGITILAKNTAITYKNIKINIVDTPGHVDFGGEVERSMNLVDGALLLVDASEGPLPQTRFVLKKALDKQLPIIVVINKIDRTDARISEVINEIYDLFIDLGATDEQIEFPILYTDAKRGIAHRQLHDSSNDLQPLFETILSVIPGPLAHDQGIPQCLITNLDYDPYVGQIAIGRLTNGILQINKQYALCRKNNRISPIKISSLYTFHGLQKKSVDTAESGDIIAIAGISEVEIGDTISALDTPKPLPRIAVDEPTIAMIFFVNTSPFSGKEGSFLTSRHLQERLGKEALGNVSLRIKSFGAGEGFEVCGRGELQLAILIETMRREGFELMVSKPRIITKEENGQIMEPMEQLFLDIPEVCIGIVTEKISTRKGRMTNLINTGSGRVVLEFMIPSRGLIGFRQQFLTDTKGTGSMNTLLAGYEPWCGPIPQRLTGTLIADRAGKVTNYASLALADRGELFVSTGTSVYQGMVIGERNRPEDLNVNITKEKKFTNVRSSTAEATVILKPPRLLSLDQAIEFIAEDELVEVTPLSIRIRKMELDPLKRKRQKREAEK